MSTSANGRAQRKSLAEQIDRLDRILDGFADGVQEAVATAVQQAVTQAVQAAVVEVLSNPVLQQRLRPDPPVSSGKVRGLARLLCGGLASALRCCWGCVSTATARVRQRVMEVAVAVGQGRQALVHRLRGGLSTLGRRVWVGGLMVVLLARRYRKPLLIALAVGVVIGVASYLAGPEVASLFRGVAGFVGSLMASGISRLRRALASDELEECRSPRVA